MKKWILLSLICFAPLWGCDETPSVSRGEEPAASDDGANDPPNTPADTPSNWRQLKLTLARDENSANCPFQVFTIENSGKWNFVQCSQSANGQLSATESESLDQRANAALATTQVAPCPEVIIFDQPYVYAQPKDQNITYTYDPQNACYTGGRNEVEALRNYLKELQLAKVNQ